MSMREALRRCDANFATGIRAKIEEIERTRPSEGRHFEFTAADRRNVENETKVAVDDHQPYVRGSWHSYLNANVVPVRDSSFPRVSTLDELRGKVTKARRENRKLRPIGSGHSFSDVCQTEGVLVDTHGLTGEIEIDQTWLRDRPVGMNGMEIDPRLEMIQIKAGTTIRDLNRILDEKGKALLNMGGYDGQTFVGAASTSTHGTGIGLPPFCDMILSMIVVTETGEVIRVEPENGITDPRRYPRGEPELIQDDDVFYSMVVSLGCMGIIYSVILQVRDEFFLEEVQSVHRWNEVRAELRENNYRTRRLVENRHFNVLINPYMSNSAIGRERGRRMCMVTTMHEVPHVLVEGPARRADLFFEIDASRHLRFAKEETLASSFNTILFGASALVPYASKSHKAFIAGGAEIGGYGAEWAFPLESYLPALDVIFDVLRKSADAGEQLQCAPISLRFVKASKAYLSPQYGSDRCMIELLNLFGTPGWPGRHILMHRYFDALIELGGIPHWGLEFNDLTFTKRPMHEMYPKWNSWIEIYKRFNSTGIFNGPLTDRLGISIS